MQLKLVKTIWLKELRDMLRDRRTLFVVVVLPMLMYPLLFIGMMQMMMFQMGKMEQKPARVAVIGRDEAPALTARLDAVPGLQVVDTIGWRAKIIAADMDAVLVIPKGFSDSVALGKSTSIELAYNKSKDMSAQARERLNKALTDFKDAVVAQRLVKLQADTSLLTPFAVKEENLATAQQQQGKALGMYLGYMLIIMTLLGAFYPAVDLTAGEKERGTLETLLVSPASRADIAYGKFGAVVVIALITALLNLISMGGTLLYMVHFSGKGAAAAIAHLAISPLSLIVSLALIVPLAVTFAALMIAVAVSARNYKEGTSLLSPLMMLVILPAFVSFLPGTEMSLAIALIPVANISLLIKEFMSGATPWGYTLIAFASTSALAVSALAWATSQFKQESVLFRHAEDVRWSPFRRRRGALPSPFPSAGTALLLVAVELVLLAALSGLAEKWGVQRLLLISQLAIILPPLLILRRGGYDRRRVLALNAPKPMAWLATVLLIVGGWLIAIELASIQNMISPFPKEMLDKFIKFFDELNKLPAPTVLFYLAVLPGICEETLCRGFLLHSFMPRFGKWGGVVLTAVAFGLLHMDPYRFVATTFLGLILGVIVVRTGSIFPAMLFHAANNALAYVVQKNEQWISQVSWLNEGSSELLPWWAVLIAAGLLLGGLAWLKGIDQTAIPVTAVRAVSEEMRE